MAAETSPDMRAASADLAFMRAIAEDRDPLPALYGWHLFAIGACFGPAVLFVWAGVTGLIDMPTSWTNWATVVATVVYMPILIALLVRGSRGPRGGPTQTAVWFAWAGVGMMTVTILIGLIGASRRLDADVMLVWPSVALALYGGVWTLTALVRRAKWHCGVALTCAVFSIASGWFASTPTQWLFLGLGMVLCLAGPGLAIVRKAHAAAA